MNTKTASMGVTSGFLDTLKSLKSLTNPSVILAIISLMGALNTAEAGPLKDLLKGKAQQQEQGVQQQEDAQSNKISLRDSQHGDLPTNVIQTFQKFIDDNKVSEVPNAKFSRVFEVDGVKYAVGFYKDSKDVDFHHLKVMADFNVLVNSSVRGETDRPVITSRFYGNVGDNEHYVLSVSTKTLNDLYA